MLTPEKALRLSSPAGLFIWHEVVEENWSCDQQPLPQGEVARASATERVSEAGRNKSHECYGEGICKLLHFFAITIL